MLERLTSADEAALERFCKALEKGRAQRRWSYEFCGRYSIHKDLRDDQCNCPIESGYLTEHPQETVPSWDEHLLQWGSYFGLREDITTCVVFLADGHEPCNDAERLVRDKLFAACGVSAQ